MSRYHDEIPPLHCLYPLHRSHEQWEIWESVCSERACLVVSTLEPPTPWQLRGRQRCLFWCPRADSCDKSFWNKAGTDTGRDLENISERRLHKPKNVKLWSFLQHMESRRNRGFAGHQPRDLSKAASEGKSRFCGFSSGGFVGGLASDRLAVYWPEMKNKFQFWDIFPEQVFPRRALYERFCDATYKKHKQTIWRISQCLCYGRGFNDGSHETPEDLHSFLNKWRETCLGDCNSCPRLVFLPSWTPVDNTQYTNIFKQEHQPGPWSL